MNREGHKNIAFFVGPEVEHTPAYSRKTLFVVGKQALDTIVSFARDHKVTHIFMGANHSFNSDNNDPYWNHVITALLDRGFWVTLDYQAHQHQDVLSMLNKGIWQSRMFVPLLSVRIPKVQTSSPNLTVKIDDIDFKATNPGVWCMHFHEVTDSNRFTDWIEYGSDLVIEEIDEATPMPPYSPEPDPALKVKVTDLKALKPVIPGSNRTFDVMADEEEVKNDGSLGLDIDAKSSLKADPDATQETDKNIALPTSPQLAAEAYAEGAKNDPLSAEGSKKGTKKK